jgi:polysaccharide export outer membrane protein
MAADLVTAPVAGADYVIGPGDVLQVSVLRHPDMTVVAPVRPDGKISTQMAENVVAAGKTPSMLSRDLEEKLGKFLRSPEVNIVVTQPAGFIGQVKVIGQVNEPQGVPFRDGMKVLDAVLAAGGVARFAALNRSKLLRTENGKQREIPIKLGKLMKDGDLKQNIELKPGDVLLVPQSRF